MYLISQREATAKGAKKITSPNEIRLQYILYKCAVVFISSNPYFTDDDLAYIYNKYCPTIHFEFQ